MATNRLSRAPLFKSVVSPSHVLYAGNKLLFVRRILQLDLLELHVRRDARAGDRLGGLGDTEQLQTDVMLCMRSQ